MAKLYKHKFTRFDSICMIHRCVHCGISTMYGSSTKCPSLLEKALKRIKKKYSELKRKQLSPWK